MLMMGIRIGCFLAMALVTPYGWWTFVFAAGAIFLPYVAVILANVGRGRRRDTAIKPGARDRGTPPGTDRAAAVDPDSPLVHPHRRDPGIDPPRDDRS